MRATAHLDPNLRSATARRNLLEVGHRDGIYTMETGKTYKSVPFFFSFEPTVTSLPLNVSVMRGLKLVCRVWK